MWGAVLEYPAECEVNLSEYADEGLIVPVMEWSESLVLDCGVMDETHRELIELLNRLADATDEKMLTVLDDGSRTMRPAWIRSWPCT
jgi:hypothetical protein